MVLLVSMVVAAGAVLVVALVRAWRHRGPRRFVGQSKTPRWFSLTLWRAPGRDVTGFSSQNAVSNSRAYSSFSTEPDELLDAAGSSDSQRREEAIRRLRAAREENSG